MKSEVGKIIVDNGKTEGIRLKNGSVYYSESIILTIDVNVTMKKLVGLDTVQSVNNKYAKRIESVKMTTSSFTVNLGLDENIPDIDKLKCGYALLTSEDDSFSKLYQAFKNNKSSISEDCFFIGISCPQCFEGEKPVLTLQTIPISIFNWSDLRNNNRAEYVQQKERVAEIIIDIVEKYLVHNLREYIVFKDISSPATFGRYSGSPTGSIYDMAAMPENFGANRLPITTPIEGLLLPKFAHGVFGAMNSGLQVVDMLLDGKVLHGNSMYKKAKS